MNDHFIEDASFLRLKNLTLGYTIPFKKIVSSCRVYFSAENLFTITGYSGWDPEVDTKANEAASQVEANKRQMLVQVWISMLILLCVLIR